MTKERICSLLIMLTCCVVAAVAKPAKPGWITVTQSDGTTLTVQAVGNAFNHAILTTDGLMVERGSDGDFYYTSSLTGLTAVRAHNEGQRTATETAFIGARHAQLTMPDKPISPQRGNGQFAVGGSNADAGVPSLGERRIPIILVEYKDKKFSNTREDIIESMLTGNESVGQYFRDQSNGKYQPEFDVFGIYTLSQTRAYYGSNVNGTDKNLGAMVTEAVQLAAADGISFKPYDTNDDDYCDVVIIIYAGVGEADASTTYPESIWPCNWDLNTAAYYSGNGAFRPSNGDPLVNHFAAFNELYGGNDNDSTIDGIGTFTHEFGHCLGLPDFYDTGNGNHYGLGNWDVMCLGCYNNGGFTPPGYTAYEKVFMGWVDYITPQPGTYYTLPVWNQQNEETDKALCIKSDINQNEYFVIENHKKQGWDLYAPGEGIMITHVTYNARRWLDNSPNNQDIQLMTLMNADNSWTYYDEDTDLWPQPGKTEFTDNSTPAARLNMRANGTISGSAGYLGKPITDMVINEDGTASFWYMKGAALNPALYVTSTDVNMGGIMLNNSVTKTFRVVGAALTGNVTLTLNDPNGVFTIDPETISAADAANGVMVNVTFTPVALTDYSATVTLSSDGVEDIVVNLAGEGLIERYAPVMQPADESYINLTQFRADWIDRTSAENVASYTLEVSAKPAVQLLGSVDGSNYTGNYTETSLSAPWGSTSLFGGNNAIYIYSGGNITFTIPEGYNSTIFTLKLTTVSHSYGIGNFAVSTPQTPAVQHYFNSGETYSWLVTASSGEKITITSSDPSYSPDIARIEVYSGDANETTMRAAEGGNADYRLITGITDKFCLVEDLKEGGTFLYKVKSLFNDGTESDWSNIEEVTLFDQGHGFEPGDVNHDREVNITDVTILISSVLGTDITMCDICADINGDNMVNISDVTMLISMIAHNAK